MSAMTQNHENKSCTVWLIRQLTSGRELSVHFTYLNQEKIWPVRGAALKFANQLLTAEQFPQGLPC